MGGLNDTSADVTAALKAITADLQQVSPRSGLLRFGSIGFVCLSLITLAWLARDTFTFLGIAALAGLSYAFWLISTHDMLHGTLTGWRWFETIAPRLMSWPLLWPYGLYSELHRLHHAWNGIDLRDPERVQWTWDEYQKANPLLRWYVRHQWTLDIFVLGGMGLIYQSLVNSWRLQAVRPRLRQQFWIDLIGILLVQSLLLGWAMFQGQGWRYLFLWLVLERVIGIVAQSRAHLEHYALWGKAKGHQLTQLYASRNLKTHPWVGWLMGGLNYHAVHHAFPSIPFNRLPTAFERIQTILQEHGLPLMPLGEGYLREAWWFLHGFSVIGDINAPDSTDRYKNLHQEQKPKSGFGVLRGVLVSKH